MNRFLSTKFLVAATLATAALGAANVADARPEVFLSVGLQSGPAWVEPARGYVQPQPGYVQTQPVYMDSAPVYVRPPVFVSPRQVFERPAWRGDDDARFEWERERAWRHAEWRHHEWREEFRGGGRDDRDRRHDHRD